VESDYPREYVPAATGLVTFTPTESKYNPLRLGVYIAPKPVSAVHGSDVTFQGSSTTASIALTGRTIAQGSGTTGYTALAAPFVLGGTDPAEAFPDGSAKQSLEADDIRAFGASSTAGSLSDKSTGVVSFGVQTEGPDANPGAVSNVEVLIDTDRDGTPDYLVYGGKSAVVDATFATTVDLATGETVDAEPLNGGAPGQDVNTFDSSVKVLPVALSALGYTSGSTDTAFDYQVVTESVYAPAFPTSGSQVVDETKTTTFDPYAPALSFTQGGKPGTVFADTGSIDVSRAATTTTTPDVLLLHLHNAANDQADVLSADVVTPKVTLTDGSAVTVTGSPVVGKRLTAHHGSWDARGVTYQFQWLRDGRAVRGATGQTYTAANADRGHTLAVTVTASAKGYAPGTATSKPTAVVTRK
jgi:hypothetical protein